jgi:hypothetical protein
MRIVLLAGVLGSFLAPSAHAQAGREPHVVVALIDTGINPYNVAFRDTSPFAYQHPSTYIDGYPADAEAINITFDHDTIDEALAADGAEWAKAEPRKLYWFPGTKIVGAISLGAPPRNCGPAQPPPLPPDSSCPEHIIFDDNGHGTMTASRAAANGHSLAPDARIVEIEGLGRAGSRWAADGGWIDVQSNSWLSLVPPPANVLDSKALTEAARKHLVFAASGNGTAYTHGVAPTPTYLLNTAAPGVIVVGAHDNGNVTAWAGAPPVVVADGYGGWSASNRSLDGFAPDPRACCTSASAPYAAGGAAAIVLEARRLEADTSSGVHGDVLAHGDYHAPSGPLDDATLTLDEAKLLVRRTASARMGSFDDDGLEHWLGHGTTADHTEYGPGANPYCEGCFSAPVAWLDAPAGVPAYPLIGYGAVDHSSVDLARAVLRGDTPIPARATEDAFYTADQLLRTALYVYP